MENKVNEPRFRSLVKNLNDIFDNVVQNIITETIENIEYSIIQDDSIREFKTDVYTNLIKIPEKYFNGSVEIKIDGLNIYQTVHNFTSKRKNGYVFIKFDSKIKLGTEVKIINKNTKEEWTWVFGGEENYW